MRRFIRTVFFTPGEKRECELFHKTEWGHKHGIVGQIKSHRIKTLVNRILDRNFSSGPLQAKSREYQSHLDRLRSFSEEHRIKGYRGDTKYNRHQALEELKELESESLDPDMDQKKILAWLDEYIKNSNRFCSAA